MWANNPPKKWMSGEGRKNEIKAKNNKGKKSQ